MRTRIIKTVLLLPLLCLFLCAFTIDESSSLKSLTKPYITTYECTAARLGNENIMEKYEYIRITFLDEEQLEVSLKRKNGRKNSYTCPYTYDEKTKRFNAELGIWGFRFKQDAKIENGKFTLCMPILGRTLLMNFQS